MKSLLVKLLAASATVVLAFVFIFSGHFASVPAADAATAPLQPREFFGPGMRGLQALEQMFLALEATVSSFAQSFTSARITTPDLCISDQSGAQTCITKPQLDALLSGGGAAPTTPQVQVSDPIVTISNVSSTTTDVSSTTPPTSPPTDTSTSSTSTASTTDAPSTAQ